MLDHEDSGSGRSEIMNVIDCNILEREENRYTLFLLPLPVSFRQPIDAIGISAREARRPRDSTGHIA
jgi:hypothetical protein